MKRGQHHTEQTKKKMREARKKQIPSQHQKEVARKLMIERNPMKNPESRRKLSDAKKGFKHTEETKRKWSEMRKGQRLGHKVSKETREKISRANKGKKHTKETIKKLSLLTKKQWREGKTSTKGLFKKGQNLGEEHPNWNGGSSYEPYSINWTKTLKKSIKERDRYTCRVCLSTPEALFIHHIDYDKKNCNPDNLITLCNSCHGKTNHNRETWRWFFKLSVKLCQQKNNGIK